MERWIRFALSDVERNWKRFMLSGVAFILGISFMAGLLVITSGAARIGAPPESQEDGLRPEILLRAFQDPVLFQQVLDETELERLRDPIYFHGVERATPYTLLDPVFFTFKGSSDPSTSRGVALCDSHHGVKVTSGRAPIRAGEAMVRQHSDGVLAMIDLGDTLVYHARDPSGKYWASTVCTCGIGLDGQEFLVTGFYQTSVEILSDVDVIAPLQNEVPINMALLVFENPGAAKEAYHKVSERYRDKPLRVGGQIALHETVNEKRGKWSIFLFLVATVATAIGSITLVNGFQYASLSRVREIGIMRSVGASKRQILGLFLFEHLSMTLVFLALGLAAGVAVGGAVNHLMFTSTPGREDLQATLSSPLQVVAYPALVASIIGFIASMIPSIKASRVKPREVLNYE